MNLRAERINRGWSVEQFAEMVNAKPQTVRHWERAGSKPRDPRIAKAVADLLGVKVTDLWPVQPWATVNWGIDGPRNDVEPEPTR